MSAGRAAPAGGERIDRAFEAIAREGRLGVMTHIVLGHPDLATSHRVVDTMVAAGVDLIEVQIPFSDPTADGPVITAACQEALEGGVRVADALEFMGEVTSRHPTPFLFMTYLNIAFGFRGGKASGGGLRAFAREAAAAGASGLIVPDIPPEERQEGYPDACREHGLHPVHVVSPNIGRDRLEKVREVASGFLYCTSRTGTTGRDVALDTATLVPFLALAREVCALPLAVGFSIKSRAQIEALSGHAEVAVVGTHLMRARAAGGIEGLERELAALLARG